MTKTYTKQLASKTDYTPDVLTDWDGNEDPGNVDAALDQLAERVDDNEGALGSLTNDHGSLDGLQDEADHPYALLHDGTRPLTDDWDAGSHKVKAEQLESDITAGTAPLIVASDTVVANLNADKLDGNEAAAFAAVDHKAAHVTGGDDKVRDATDAQDGLATAAQITKLNGITTGADVTGSNPPQAHHDSHDPDDGSDALDCAAASEIAGVQAAAEGSAHGFARSDHAHQIQHGIADDHLVTVDDADAADNDYAKFTASGLEGRDKTEMLSDLNVADGADVTGSNPPQAHNHNASAINAGTLVHERGGLEADVSAYNGLVKISGGTTSAKGCPAGDVVGTTDTQTLSAKTLTTPVIASLINAAHNHEDAAGGGTLGAAAVASGTLDDARIDAKHRQVAHQWYLEDPEAGDKYVLCKVPVAATIKRVNHIAIGADSSADFNIDIRAEATPETGGTEVWDADKTVNPTHSIETVFDNDGVAQYGILVVLIEAVGETVPDRIWIGLVLEYD